MRPDVIAPGAAVAADQAQGQSRDDTPIINAPGAVEHCTVEKLKANLRAKFALAGGFVLHELADGSFLVSRWNLTRPCRDLRAVAEFLRQIGGQE